MIVSLSVFRFFKFVLATVLVLPAVIISGAVDVVPVGKARILVDLIEKNALTALRDAIETDETLKKDINATLVYFV